MITPDSAPGPRRLALVTRLPSMGASKRVREGHPASPLRAAEICTALWTRHMKLLAADPHWFDRDRFVLSAGHGSPPRRVVGRRGDLRRVLLEPDRIGAEHAVRQLHARRAQAEGADLDVVR